MNRNHAMNRSHKTFPIECAIVFATILLAATIVAAMVASGRAIEQSFQSPPTAMQTVELFDLLNERMVPEAVILVQQSHKRDENGATREISVSVVLRGEFYSFRADTCEGVIDQVREKLGGEFVAIDGD